MTTIYVREHIQLPSRKVKDFYPTEPTLVWAALKEFAPRRMPKYILDPGAGTGVWGTLAWKFYNRQPIVYGVEVRESRKPIGFKHWKVGDFLEVDLPLGYFDLIVGNPPYGPEIKGRTNAEHFIRKSLDLLKPNGTLIFLLRLAFQSGVMRYRDLWNYHPPVTVGVLSRRPSFYGGGTNATDYGLFHWIKGLGEPRAWNVKLLMYDRYQRRFRVK